MNDILSMRPVKAAKMAARTRLLRRRIHNSFLKLVLRGEIDIRALCVAFANIPVPVLVNELDWEEKLAMILSRRMTRNAATLVSRLGLEKVILGMNSIGREANH
ncbi:unnamed protein product, partial [Amoebophrya sp. A25]|eukprot:GSA25T00023316001.1